MISVIIPTYNEAAHIQATIKNLLQSNNRNLIEEIIIADGGSIDNTVELAKEEGIKVVISPIKGRAAQMNYGASMAKADILYFLHADSIPPKNFVHQIIATHRNGVISGCFRLAFDFDHWFLKANAWFTRFNVNAVRFGDQSLFITKEAFKKCGGFREDLLMMEDQEIIHRIKKIGRFKVLNDFVITSARKYRDNGIYRMQGIFFTIWALYYLGYSQDQLVRLHKKLIRHHKL